MVSLHTIKNNMSGARVRQDEDMGEMTQGENERTKPHRAFS